MDTELYIVGKDVAELKIPKKFRFEKISSDFKMSILLYGKLRNWPETFRLKQFGTDNHGQNELGHFTWLWSCKNLFSGQLPVEIKNHSRGKTNCFRAWAWGQSKLENALSAVTIPALGTDWANTDWHDKQNEVSFVTTDVTCTHSPANLWDTEEGFQYRSLIG